jgi:hypothetical protein
LYNNIWRRSKMKKQIFLAIAIVIAGLMIVGTSSTAIHVQPEEHRFFVNKNPEMEIAGIEMSTFAGEKELIVSSGQKIATPVALGYHPALASDALGYVVYGFETDEPNVYYTASDDGGNLWAEGGIGWLIDPPPTLPDLDACGDGRFIGTMLPDYLASDGSELYKVEVIDPMVLDDTGYSCPYWDWWDVGDGYDNFRSVAVAGYTAVDPDENLWGFGGHAMVGDHGGESGDNTNFFSYQFDDTGYAWIYRWNGLNGATQCAHDIDPVTLYSYAAWNFDNEGDLDIYVSVMDFGQWVPLGGYVGHPDVTDTGIEVTGNDDYLDISAQNDNVIVVSERDGDIVAYYSPDGMTSVMESSIETDAANPRIVHFGDDKAICSFVKNGAVSYSITTDGGETWTTSEEVDEPENYDVPEELKAADVCSIGGVSWMNEDDGLCYFAGGLFGDPPTAPAIDGETNGDVGEEYDYGFTSTDPDGDDIAEYIVDWGDGTPEEIISGPFASGEEADGSHTWITGGDFTITAIARDVNGAVGPEGSLDVTMPRGIISMNSIFLRMLERFPHAFPLLRHILGL